MGNHKVLKTAGINLRYSMYDFIDAVKKHHIIWDREHENFHNRELRDQAWQQIGLQLCKNFEVASAGEKQEIAKTLLKRWKNTRDSYLRVNRLRQSGEEISRASYIYEKELSFLLDVKAEEEETLKEDPKAFSKRKQFRILRTPVKRRCESDNQGTLPNVDETHEATSLHNTLSEDGLHTMLDTLNCTTNTSTVPGVCETHSSRGEPTTTFPQDINGANSSTISPLAAASADPDPDQAFFDSIKPDMQRMSSDQKLEFKIEVLKILRHFKPISN